MLWYLCSPPPLGVDGATPPPSGWCGRWGLPTAEKVEKGPEEVVLGQVGSMMVFRWAGGGRV